MRSREKKSCFSASDFRCEVVLSVELTLVLSSMTLRVSGIVKTNFGCERDLRRQYNEGCVRDRSTQSRVRGTVCAF
jgi:hypothetical protein